MTCSGYDPRQVIQLDGIAPVFGGVPSSQSFDGSDCGCACTAMAVDDATCGAKRTTATRIRELMNDRNGGTNLNQADEVANRYFGVDLLVRYRLPWDEYERIRKSGRGAYLQIGYDPIRRSRFAGSTTFTGNHGIYDPPSGKVRDPLADGRRPGIYQFHGEVYPRDLIRRAAGKLNLEARDGYPPRYLGEGLVYAAFTRDNDASYRVSVDAGSMYWWDVVSGNAVRRSLVRTGGFSAACTAPSFYPWPNHKTSRIQLVRLTSGAHAGKWVHVNALRTHLREVA